MENYKVNRMAADKLIKHLEDKKIDITLTRSVELLEEGIKNALEEIHRKRMRGCSGTQHAQLREDYEYLMGCKTATLTIDSYIKMLIILDKYNYIDD